MTNMILVYITLAAIVTGTSSTDAFVNSPHSIRSFILPSYYHHHHRCCETSEPSTATSSAFPLPLLDELRDVAMRLHTRDQSPREGQAEEAASAKKSKVPYVPTHADYLQFLVDSHAVYVVMEDIVCRNELLVMFRNTGLERTLELEKDIGWMCTKFDLPRPDVGNAGRAYAEELSSMITCDADIPQFICHYYNYYFAHLAGGRMIGKQMSRLLLDGETLEFYKWGDDVNGLKDKVKHLIEETARQWTREERDKCVNATVGAFKGGGAINGYLYGESPN